MTDKVFSYQTRIYYEDTDAGGVVYHSNYLNIAERARTEYVRIKGVNQLELSKETGILFVVHSLNIEYKSPLYLDDIAEVKTQLIERKNASFVMQQDIRKLGNDIVKAKITVKITSVKKDKNGNYRSCKMPDDLFTI